jgi:hypothetical protein
MKKYKRIVLSILLSVFILEGNMLGMETYNYVRTKSAHLTVNGRIVCEIDNLTNFSGMATR